MQLSPLPLLLLAVALGAAEVKTDAATITQVTVYADRAEVVRTFKGRLEAGEQTRVFRTIPGLEKAEFVRFGVMHRNTFLNSPELLDRQLRLKSAPHIRFAGQVTGCEGYVESSAVGLVAGMMVLPPRRRASIRPAAIRR